MEELAAFTTSKCDQFAPFVVVRIQFTCFHMDSNQADKREFQMRYFAQEPENKVSLDQQHIG